MVDAADKVLLATVTSEKKKNLDRIFAHGLLM
jgi:hypothetical protein